MFSRPADVAFVAIYVASVIALIFSIIFWRRELDRWMPQLLKKILVRRESQRLRKEGFFGFWGAAVQDGFSFGWVIFTAVGVALPDILAMIHKLFPQLWATFEFLHPISAHPVRTRLICLGIAIVVYLIYAPYNLYSRLAAWAIAVEHQRPIFVYESSSITNRFAPMGTGSEIYAWSDVLVRIRNTGPATAYNPKCTIYYCWMSDPSRIDRNVVDCQTRTRTHASIDFSFHVDRPAVRLGTNGEGLPIWGFSPKEQIFVWLEIESRANAEDGELCKEELERFCFFPFAPDQRPRRLAYTDERLRKLADPHFEKFRQFEDEHRATQQLTLNMEVSAQSQA